MSDQLIGTNVFGDGDGCGTCNGTGKYRNKKCPTCGGDGYVIRRKPVRETKKRDLALAEKQMAHYLAVQKKTKAEVADLEKKVVDLKAVIEGDEKPEPDKTGPEPEAEDTKEKEAPTQPTMAGSR